MCIRDRHGIEQAREIGQRQWPAPARCQQACQQAVAGGLHGRQWHRRLVVGGQCGWIGFSGLPTLLSAAFAAPCRRGRRSLGTGLRRGRDLGCGFRREAGAGLRPLMRPTCDLRVGGHRHQRRFVDWRRRNAGRLPGLRGRRDARGDRRRLPCYRSGRRHCWRWRSVSYTHLTLPTILRV